jgi:NAD(P)-dependent dehydrogenase (short-subunit alcohol dehydrogenase family)
MNSQCVCISGSTHGIGYGIAEAFAKKGARLVINSNLDSNGALEKLSKLTECHFIQSDLSTVAGAEYFVNKSYELLGNLDTLINNAGTFLDSDFENISEEDFDKTINLNVRGYMFAAKAFAKKVTNNNQDKSILCIGSSNSKSAEKNSVIYDTSKGAVLMMIRSLAISLAKKNIRVNGIGPGILETPLTKAGLEKGNNKKVLENQIPLGRIGLPKDVGGAAVFLSSKEAEYITGQMLYIDGGILANQMNWDESLL